MNWVETKARLRDAEQRREAIISAGADDLWNSLRVSVMAAAKQYAERYPAEAAPFDYVQTSPPDAHEVVWVDIMTPPRRMPPQQPKSKRRVTISMDRKTHTITAEYSNNCANRISLRIGASNDGDACFMLGTERITLEAATEIILSPVLYPDLVSEPAQATVARA